LRLTLNVAVKTVLSSEKPALRDCQIDVDGSRLFLLTPKSDGELGINLWETSHPLSERLISWCQQTVGPEAVTDQSKATVVDAIHELNQTAVLSDSGFLPDDARFQTANVTLPSERKDNDQRIRAEVHRVYPQMIRDLLADLHDLFSHELRRLEYLGPLRSYPSRQLFDNETTDPNWRAGGGFAWKTVKEDKAVREKVNGWLEQNPKAKYRLEVQRVIGEHAIRRQLEAAVVEHYSSLMVSIGMHEERSGDSIADGIGLSGFNYRDYVDSHPDLRSKLLDSAKQAFEDSGMYEDEELENRQQILESNAEDWVNNELNDNGGMIWEEIWDHFVDENSQRHSSLAATFVDPAKAAESMTAKIFESKTEEHSYLYLWDHRTETAVTHRDVGIGISQVLPVLVHAYGSKNKLIAIEQPEIHLHPALQAELGDLFIESALGENGNHFILETHSEHLILRLLRRIRETKRNKVPEGKRGLRPEDVSILYVAPDAEGSRVLVMDVNEHGKLTNNWPDGFFEERLEELF